MQNTTGISWFNLRLILESLCTEPLYFYCDMTMISYFNIIINIIIITNPKFSRLLKIFIVFSSHHNFFVKIVFHHVTVIFTFFDYTINKILNCIFSLVCIKRLTKGYYHQHILIYGHNCKQYGIWCLFGICLYKTLLDFSFHYFLALKYFQNLHKL